MTVQQPAPERRGEQTTGHPSGPLPTTPMPPPKRSRVTKPAKIGLVIVAVLLVFGAGMAVARSDGGSSVPSSPAAPPTADSGTSTQASGAAYMPDYRGYTIMAAAYGLRSTLGPNLQVQSPGGAASQYMTVGSQDPAPGTVINVDTVIRFWPVASSSATTGASGSAGAASAAPDPNAITEGTYEVGVDLQPGTYKTAGAYSCYWARLRGNSGEFKDIIANGNEPGRGSITVSKSDKFVKFSGVCTWARR